MMVVYYQVYRFYAFCKREKIQNDKKSLSSEIIEFKAMFSVNGFNNIENITTKKKKYKILFIYVF